MVLLRGRITDARMHVVTAFDWIFRQDTMEEDSVIIVSEDESEVEMTVEAVSATTSSDNCGLHVEDPIIALPKRKHKYPKPHVKGASPAPMINHLEVHRHVFDDTVVRLPMKHL